jgi:hypothetical protein
VNSERRVLCTLAHGPHLELLDIVGPALERYADTYGYELVVIRHRLDPSRPTPWDKVVLLHDLVRTNDVVVWIDVDAIVLPDAPDIADAMVPGRFLNLVEHHTFAGRVPNSGVMAIAGGEYAREFWERVWNERRCIHDVWWENSAVMRVLGYRTVGTMQPVLPSRWRTRLGRLDGAWNSIPIAPAPKPFVVHFPGEDLESRKRQLSQLAAVS